MELITGLKEHRGFHHIKGLYWKENGKIIANPGRPFLKVENIPFPLTRKTRRYFELAAQSGEMMYPTSRGCPHGCAFCYNQVFNCGKWRPFPLKKWEQEMDILVREFAFTRMETGDDNIGGIKKRIRSIGAVMKRHGIIWDTDIRPEYIDEEMIHILEENGCSTIFMGLNQVLIEC